MPNTLLGNGSVTAITEPYLNEKASLPSQDQSGKTYSTIEIPQGGEFNTLMPIKRL